MIVFKANWNDLKISNHYSSIIMGLFDNHCFNFIRVFLFLLDF